MANSAPVAGHRQGQARRRRRPTTSSPPSRPASPTSTATRSPTSTSGRATASRSRVATGRTPRPLPARQRRPRRLRSRSRSARSTATAAPAPTVSGSTTVASEQHDRRRRLSASRRPRATSPSTTRGGNDGTIAGATRVNSGKFGRALYFDGEDDVVNVADDPTLRLEHRHDARGLGQARRGDELAHGHVQGGEGRLGYSLYSNANTDNARAPTSAPRASSMRRRDRAARPERAGRTWRPPSTARSCACTSTARRSAPRRTDGEMLARRGPADLRRATTIWGEHFQGSIDEVRIYNRPLSATDIRADMDAPVIAGTPAPPPDSRADAGRRVRRADEWPIVPVHLATAVQRQGGGLGRLRGRAELRAHVGSVDAASSTPIPTGRNLFCAGHITLPDGRLLVVGGHINAYEGRRTRTCSRRRPTPGRAAPTWREARWYPTGDDAAGRPRVRGLRRQPRSLNRPGQPGAADERVRTRCRRSTTRPTNTWQQLPQAQRWMPLYPFMFVLPNGKLFDAGPDKMTRTLDTDDGPVDQRGHEPDRRPERGPVPARARS